jgi:hypothetical protein
MTRTIRLSIDGRHSAVTGRRHGRRLVETFASTDPGPTEGLRLTLRSARLLRPGGVRHLSVELESPYVLYQFLSSTPGADRASLRESAMRRLALASEDVYFDVARTGPDAAGEYRAVSVSVAREAIDPLRTLLERRRFDGDVTLDLGPLARLRRLLQAIEPAVHGRPGIVIDVSRAAVSVFQLDGSGLQTARCMPRGQDVETLVAVLFGEALDDLPERSHPRVRHPSAPRAWLHLGGTDVDVVALRRACAAVLTAGSSIALVVPIEHRRTADRGAPSGPAALGLRPVRTIGASA